MDNFADLASLFSDIETIRSGGMATLIMARDPDSGQRVAVKALNLEHVDVPEIRERLVKEGEILRTVASSHVPKVLRQGQTERDRPYLVLEQLEGKDLEEELATRRRLPPEVAIRIAIDVCAALTVAHARGIVHRDIKPGNIFLTRHGAMLIDFGIAKLQGSTTFRETSAREALGTASYMAPEQIRCSARVDGAVDVWSLGVVLFEMLTGRLPFDGGDAILTMKAILEEPAPSLSEIGRFPSGLSVIVLRCLTKQPELRWRTVDALRKALETIERAILLEGPEEVFADAETMPLPTGFELISR